MHDHKPNNGSDPLHYEGPSSTSESEGIVLEGHLITNTDSGNLRCTICGETHDRLATFSVRACDNDNDDDVDVLQRALGTAEKRLSDLSYRAGRDASHHIHAALAGIEETLEYGGEVERMRHVDQALGAAEIAADDSAEETLKEIARMRQLVAGIKHEMETRR
jgi:hypothetical protein